jgi:hypothetical protein
MRVGRPHGGEHSIKEGGAARLGLRGLRIIIVVDDA